MEQFVIRLDTEQKWLEYMASLGDVYTPDIDRAHHFHTRYAAEECQKRLPDTTVIESVSASVADVD